MKICPFCGSNESDEAMFCTACGKQFDENTVEEPQITSDDTVDTADENTANNEENTVTGESDVPTSSETTVQTSQSVADKAKDFAKNNKKLLYICGVAAVIIILIAVICGIASGGKSDFKHENFPLFYVTDDEEIKFKTAGGKTKTLSSDSAEVTDIRLTSDGKTIVFGIGDSYSEYDLYYRKAGSKDSDASNILIERGVSSFEISEYGEKLFYIKNGRLYRSDFKKSVLYAKNVYSFKLSDNSDGVLLLNNDDELIYADGKIQKTLDKDVYRYNFIDDSDKVFWTDDKDKLYISGTGKNDTKELIASSVDDFKFINSQLYFLKKNKLYYSNGRDKETVIVKGPERMEYGSEDLFAVGENHALYLLDGDSAEKLCENYYTGYGDNYELISIYDDGEYSYFFRSGINLYEVEMPDDFSCVEFNDDYMYYLDEDDSLLKCKLSSKGFDVNDAEVIVDDVEYYFFDYEGKYVYITGNDNSFGIYDGKKFREVTNDLERLIFEDGDKIVYTKDSTEDGATLCMYNGSKSVEVADSVTDTVVLAYDMVYYINNDDQLLFTSNGKKSKHIDDDVQRLMDGMSLYFGYNY